MRIDTTSVCTVEIEWEDLGTFFVEGQTTTGRLTDRGSRWRVQYRTLHGLWWANVWQPTDQTRMLHAQTLASRGLPTEQAALEWIQKYLTEGVVD